MNIKNQYKLINFSKSIISSLIIVVMLLIYRLLNFIGERNPFIIEKNDVIRLLTLKTVVISGSLFLILFILFYLFFSNIKKYGNIIFKWRYLIALSVLAICVLLKLNGSSIGIWSRLLPGALDNDVLLGTSRAIRSDEYAVNTPLLFSQFYNKTGIFPYFSDTVRAVPTDMFIIYGQPVLDIAVLFRPFHWGYLLLGLERGFSFFWCARFIVLFVVSFELFMILTNTSKKLAFAGALLISLAPIIQWWFAINGLVEMLVFGELFVIMIHNYMRTESYKLRLLFSVLLAICGGGYILVFYPSWQVPLGYVFLTLIICVFFSNKNDFKFSLKNDIPIILIFLFILGSGMVYVFSKSGDTISAVMNTDYPGSRLEVGGGFFNLLFNYPINLFFPLKNYDLASNVCEISVFFDFFPLGIIIALIVLFKERKKDVFLIGFIICFIILLLYCSVSWPPFLSKLFLLSNSQPARAFLSVGFLNILILVRSMSLMDTKFNIFVSLLIALIISSFAIFKSFNINNNYFEYKMLIIVIPIILFSIYFALRKSYDLFLAICVLVAFFGGVLVNPIRQGTDVIYDNELTREIYNISHDNDGIWLVDNMDYPIPNLPIMVGAPTINSTSVYPSLETWQKIDCDKEYEKVYNRYAHINVVLTQDNDEFQLVAPDHFRLNLNIDSVNKLSVKYILSNRDINKFSDEKVTFNEIYSVGNLKIFEVEERNIL